MKSIPAESFVPMAAEGWAVCDLRKSGLAGFLEGSPPPRAAMLIVAASSAIDLRGGDFSFSGYAAGFETSGGGVG